MSAKRAGKKTIRKHAANMRLIAVILLIAGGIIFFKTWQINKEISQYEASKAELSTRIEEEKLKAKEIEQQISYIGSDDFIVEQAREKLGLVFEDEILFKKRDP